MRLQNEPTAAAVVEPRTRAAWAHSGCWTSWQLPQQLEPSTQTGATSRLPRGSV